MSAIPQPAPPVKSVVDAMMRQIRAVLGDEAVAKLQAASKGAVPAQPSPGAKPAALNSDLVHRGPVPKAESIPTHKGPPSEAVPLGAAPSQPSAIPAELTLAMFEAASEGDWKAVDDLAELGQDPEGLSEFLADRDGGTQGMMSARAFAAMTRTFAAGSRCFAAWFHDPSPRSKSRITNSENGSHAYGDTARRIMEGQGREERGEPHPETPKAALQRMKAEKEPVRETARAAYDKAVKDPGSLTGADLDGLRQHLHTLTRDEVRAKLREVMFKAGGKLKADLVDGLLEHVRGNAVAHHEGKIDSLLMDTDAQRTAQKRIDDLQGRPDPDLPADKKARDQDAEKEHRDKNDHNKRREQRHAIETAGTTGELDAPGKTSHGTPDVGSKLKQPDKMLDVRTLAPENRDGLTLDQQVKKDEPPEQPKDAPAPDDKPKPMPAAAQVTKSPDGKPENVSDDIGLSEPAAKWLEANGGDLGAVTHDTISAAARSGGLPRKVELELRKAKLAAEQKEHDATEQAPQQKETADKTSDSAADAPNASNKEPAPVAPQEHPKKPEDSAAQGEPPESGPKAGGVDAPESPVPSIPAASPPLKNAAPGYKYNTPQDLKNDAEYRFSAIVHDDGATP